MNPAPPVTRISITGVGLPANKKPSGGHHIVIRYSITPHAKNISLIQRFIPLSNYLLCMKDPRPELKPDDAERRDTPDFDGLVDPAELVSGDRTRDDFFDAVLGLDGPATTGDIADLAGHGVDAAREYLTWFERMGIVTQVTDSPAMYTRNQEYLNWRRVQHLRDRYDDDELIAWLENAVEQHESLAEQYGVESPDAVAITAHAANTGRSVESVWQDVSAWQTTRRRISLLERALQSNSGGTTGRRTVT